MSGSCILSILRGSALGDDKERERPSLYHELTCYPMRDGNQTLSADHFARGTGIKIKSSDQGTFL